jgi:hypothetical protein
MAMSIFVRKHWRKIILALTTAFWSSCDSDSTTNPPVECEGQECVQESSSSTEAPSSSSTETPSSSSIESSSSEEIQMSATLYGVFYSSSDPSFSSSSSDIDALYGVFYSSSDPSFSSSSCSEIEALYGIFYSSSDAALSSSEDIQYSSSLYGVFYSSSDPSFSSSSNAALSSSSEQRKIICYNYNSNGKITCDDGLTCEETVNPISDCTEGPCPVYGVPSPQDISYKCDNDETYTPEEFLKDHEIWSNAALYGVFPAKPDDNNSSDKKN